MRCAIEEVAAEQIAAIFIRANAFAASVRGSAHRLAADRVGDPPRERAFNPIDRDKLFPASYTLVPCRLTQQTGSPH